MVLRMTLRSQLMLSILCFTVTTLLYAGAWVESKGKGLVILTGRRYISDQFFTSGGRLISNPTYAKNEIDLYTQYGATVDLTLGAYFSALESHTGNTGTAGGVNDILLFGRYLFWSSGTKVASVQLAADKLGRANTLNIPPQNSSFNTMESVQFGISNKIPYLPHYWFIDMSTGFIQRYSAGNQLQINLTAGYKMRGETMWFMLQNYNTLDIDHPSYPQGENYHLLTLAPSVVFWINPMISLQAGMTQDFYGQNVGKGRGFFLASWLRF